ncbi:hypothetical protein TWF679_008613 [Orbilia oligospora]|uniref:Uncharacterized protein n=1 Tax=Orbilia oligospora TaxID=2813651 RepID=A0A8H8V4P5_ORBOL|nr:hypothetical protein TWF679_008613 [Orbilia oligospora]
MARHGSKLKPKGSTDEENPKLANDSRGQNPIPGLPMNAAVKLPVHRSVPRSCSLLEAIPVDPCVLEGLFFAAASGRPSDARSRHNARNLAVSRWDESGLGKAVSDDDIKSVASYGSENVSFETRDATKDVVCGTNKDCISVCIGDATA